MAVEASRIKGRLKALFPKANLSNKRLDAIAARLATKPADDAEDAAIDEVLNEANDIYSFEEMAKDEHRLINAEGKLRKLTASGGSADDEDIQDPPAPPAPVDQPAWVKEVLESNKKLEQQVQSLLTGKVRETKMATATELFNKSEVLKGLTETVKPKWINRINVESETSIEDQIAELETEYADLVQVTADNKRYAGAPPNGAANGKPTDEEISRVAAQL